MAYFANGNGLVYIPTGFHKRQEEMKTYIVYVDGIEQPNFIKAGSHNAAEKQAQKKFPGRQVSVAYTEV